MMPRASRRSSLSVRMFVGMPSGEPANSFEPGASIKEVQDDEQGPVIARNVQAERYRKGERFEGRPFLTF